MTHILALWLPPARGLRPASAEAEGNLADVTVVGDGEILSVQVKQSRGSLPGVGWMTDDSQRR